MSIQRQGWQFRMATALSLLGMLSGCFLADDDSANPIIPDGSLVQPLASGDAKLCDNGTEPGEDCDRARIDVLDNGLSRIVTWANDGDDGSVQESSEDYRLRLLKGPGVPADTYLAQKEHSDDRQRFLGLLMRRDGGGWLRESPQCDDLVTDSFIKFVTEGWIRTRDDDSLEGITCFIRRDGLTDTRIYEILSTASSDTGKVLFEG